MPQFRTIDAGAAQIRVAIEGEGPLVLMVHGFPESWFSWRHQLGPVAQAGFTAAAIDVRGYGGSDKPGDVAAYDMESLTADVAGNTDVSGAQKLEWSLLLLADGLVDGMTGVRADITRDDGCVDYLIDICPYAVEGLANARAQ